MSNERTLQWAIRFRAAAINMGTEPPDRVNRKQWKAQRDALLAQAVELEELATDSEIRKLRELVERAVLIIPQHQQNWHADAQEALTNEKAQSLSEAILKMERCAACGTFTPKAFAGSCPRPECEYRT